MTNHSNNSLLTKNVANKYVYEYWNDYMCNTQTKLESKNINNDFSGLIYFQTFTLQISNENSTHQKQYWNIDASFFAAVW